MSGKQKRREVEKKATKAYTELSNTGSGKSMVWARSVNAYALMEAIGFVTIRDFSFKSDEGLVIGTVDGILFYIRTYNDLDHVEDYGVLEAK